ncbi:MAG: helix-hairpin-helix domain-containing protein [Dehalococcoidia bacterium]|nr:helix-hairpin-helix domain-containing protein [Dehalococcoidia bacterium]
MKNSYNKTGSLREIPGVGKSIAQDLNNIGIYSISDLKNMNAEKLYDLSSKYAGVRQDKCLLYVYRTAVYYANGGRSPDKLQWWNWKDKAQCSLT